MTTPVTPPTEQTVPLRHPGRWAAAAVVLLLSGLLAQSFAVNENLAWPVVGHYLFDHVIMGGVLVTVELTVISMLIGIAVGTIVAVMRLSSNYVLSTIAWLFVWFFRGVPLLVQLIFWYNFALLFPHLGIPLLGITENTNLLISGFTAAIMGLGLSEGAYMAEIIRGGILSVDEGQEEAAKALGMRRTRTLWRIILPQAMRIIVPPTGNRLISVLKNTSLVAFIAGGDLLTVATGIYSSNFEVIALLVVATCWYLALVSIASIGQHFLEVHFSRATAMGQAMDGLGNTPPPDAAKPIGHSPNDPAAGARNV